MLGTKSISGKKKEEKKKKVKREERRVRESWVVGLKGKRFGRN